MELYIDDKRADLDARTSVLVSLSVASVTAPGYGRTGYSKSITIPMTPRNREIMGDCEQVHARDRFNASEHTARVGSDGFTVMEGVMVLTACGCSADGSGWYSFNILGGGRSWVRHAAGHGLSTLFPSYSMEITPVTIRQSWTSYGTPVRFLPVQRDVYEFRNSSVGLLPPERVLTAQDYHPFIHLRSVVKAIFEDAGYGVSSSFLDSGYFDSFYMSGNYPERDASALKSRMDFLAARFGESSASADSMGRVYADPWALYNTVGNIVDTADPREPHGGVTLEHVFDNGPCVEMRDRRIAFVPKYEISAGFEYKLRYVTGYRMVSSARLAGFDRVCLALDDVREFRLTNNFADRKREFGANRSFRCVIFDFTPGYTYQLTGKRIINPGADPEDLRPGDYEEPVIATFTSATTLVSTAREAVYADMKILAGPSQLTLTHFYGDWGLYDGYVDTTGQVEVEVTLRSRAEVVSPSSPKFFDAVYFGGADPGMNLTLKSVEVRPVFLPHPAEGSVVRFGDVAAHGISRLELINALRQMFNLCFYTDSLTKTVYIEPRAEFFGSGPVVDWTGFIDHSRPVVVEELGSDMAQTVTFRYRSGDGTVSRRNTAAGDRFGQWSASVNNANAAVAEQVHENPLFRPSLNTGRALPSAPSALLLQAGDRDGSGTRYTEDLNFPPKVVRYMGLAGLPAGEKWGWPSYEARYPFVAFHHPGFANGYDDPDVNPGSSFGGDPAALLGNGFTLCFEDRDGVAGMHRWWDGNITAYNHGRRMTLWLRLGPQDVEPFIVPNPLERDFRASFRFLLDGETSLWRLEEICDYNPSAPSTKCVFVKEI